MQASFPAKLCLLLSMTAAPAHAQTDRPAADAPAPDALLSSLNEIVALATFGSVTPRDQAAQVTRSGADYLVRLPLSGFSAPADAAARAVARPLDNGMWNIASMTFPPAGTFQPAMAKAGDPVAYSFGEQAVHGEIDPAFARPSAFTASFNTVRLRSGSDAGHSEQTIDRYLTNGTMSADASSRLTVASHAKATNWHLTAHGSDGVDSDSLVRTLSGGFSVDGLDRAQGTRLLAAARALMSGPRMPVSPGQPTSLSVAQRQDLRALTEALPGLLRNVQTEATLDDIRFTMGPARSGTMGRLRINMAGNAAEDRLNARVDVAVDGLTLAALPPGTAAYVPHHLDMKSEMTGVRTKPLMDLLRAATMPNADFAALQLQFMALLGDPDARVGIESITFDSGPVRVSGSARFTPGPNGQPGANIHLSATGMDALITQAQATPALQQAVLVMFIAKGMGRVEGESLIWDIVLGNGPPTVNGMRFGQPAAPRR